MLTYCAARLGADITLGTYQHPAFCRNIQTASYSTTLATTTVTTVLLAYKTWYATYLLSRLEYKFNWGLLFQEIQAYAYQCFREVLNTDADAKNYGHAHRVWDTLHVILRESTSALSSLYAPDGSTI